MIDDARPVVDMPYQNVAAGNGGVGLPTLPAMPAAWPPAVGSSVAPKGDWTMTPEGMPLFVANWLTYLSTVRDCLECELRHQALL
jgi:hypothetical protein